MNDIEQIKHLLSLCTPAQRQEIFRSLRKEFRIHPLEESLNTEAEIILEAIQRASGLTLRMIRGVIAEAAFQIHVVEHLSGWANVTPPGDLPYDFLLSDSQGAVRVQVKLQRSVGHRPMRASQAYRFLPTDMYVVETQRTRACILLLMRVNLLQGTYTPLTHAHAGRTQGAAPDGNSAALHCRR